MDKAIKVIHVFGSLNLGGAETRVMDIYRNIDRNEVQFDFLSLDTSSNQYYEREIVDLGGKIHKLSNPRSNGIHKHYKDLIQTFRKEKYVAVHAHTSYHMGIVMLAAYKSKIGIRISHARTSGTISYSLLAFFYHILGKVLINVFSTHLLSVSNKATRYVFGKFPIKKVHVLPNAIDHNLYILESSINNMNNGIDINRTTINVIQIGRFEKVKNHVFTINLIQQLINEKVSVNLYIIGSGVLEKEIKSVVKSRDLTQYVKFLGLRNDLNTILKHMDYLVLPSLYEGLPGVVLEAQASGIMSLVSDSVTKESDLGLGLVKFLSLNNVHFWIKELKKKRVSQLTSSEIDEKFRKSGYNISYVTSFLTKLYNSKDKRPNREVI